MNAPQNREAWVDIPTPEQRAAANVEGNPYDFGFIPAMGGLLQTHPDIGPHFMGLYRQIMFSPDGVLTRAERESIAAVAAAAQDCFY